MTLILVNNTFKYELECVIKLFFPNEKIAVNYGDLPVFDDCFYAKIKRGRCFSYLFTYVKIGDKSKRMAKKISLDCENLEAKQEIYLAKMLFTILSKMTSKTPKWGILTGVRPVKRVNDLIECGLGKEEIIQKLGKDFFVHKNKAELSYQTALTQQFALRNFSTPSFSLYISIPFCPTRCSYCTFISNTTHHNEKLISEYVENLKKEIFYTSKVMNKIGLKLDTVYFGGGTPTSLSARLLTELMREVNNCFDVKNAREYTVEAGRPDTITAEKLEAIRKYGATRISINPQTFSDEVLKVIGRNHSSKEIFDAFFMARKLGFDNINMDIIAGLPTDTAENFSHTVDKIVDLSPENVTVHTLYVKRASEIVKEREKLIVNDVGKMVNNAYIKFSKAGYNPYYLYKQKNTLDNLENTGYSKKGFESLYNIYIMEEIQTIIALGAGASTKLVRPDADIKRVFNYKFPLEYNKHFDIMLAKKDEITQYFR